MAWSLAATRSHFEHRAAIVADGAADTLTTLEGLASEKPSPEVAVGTANVVGKLAFVFPGQGGQWAGMAKALLVTSEVFRAGDCTL